MDPIDWIFFDCFNTLIDDFDERGEITGLGPTEAIPVQAGWFKSIEAFRDAYESCRVEHWGDRGGETPLDERLRFTFKRECDQSPQTIEAMVQHMLEVNEREYPKTLRITPGAPNMLEAWAPHVSMGVVSNFYLPHWPERMLEGLGLAHHFAFVVDSAAENTRKPEDRIYQIALERAKTEPSRVLFVGDDHLRDVIKPKSLGMQALHRCRHGQRPNMPASPEPDAITDWSTFRPQNFI